MQVGDVGAESAVVWAQGFVGAVEVRVIDGTTTVFDGRARALRERADTVQVPLRGLRPGRRHRVQLTGHGPEGPRRARASFTTAALDGGPVRFAWSGDVVGQGFGIDPGRGGLFAFDTLAREAPDFFIFSGDTVYADVPLPPTLPLPDGSTWTNRVTPAKARVAETLEAFRGQYRYNWLDPAYRRFFAQVPVIAQWDDHETRNNWFPGRRLDDDERYTVTDCSVLARRARRAFDEAFPRARSAEGRIFRKVSRGPLLDVFVVDARSHRSSNSAVDPYPHAFWGATQADWLARELVASKALWKVVACDMPLGLVVGDGPQRFEAVADGYPGPPGFREVEVARVLEALAAVDVRNVVFLTADVHYAAAHRYQRPFPFWEFVAGPLHAGQFGPAELDLTFGPEVVFANRRPGDPQNVAPSRRSTSYGVVEIGRGGDLRVDLRDGGGRTLHRQRVRPRPHG